AAGAVLAFLGGRLIAALLFGVEPGDPLTFAAVALFLILVGLAATILPARRAARLDPLMVLRQE
ncbi:MAG: hypothetical protein ACREMN_02835, partial [Gemmatimonadales bacterium]